MGPAPAVFQLVDRLFFVKPGIIDKHFEGASDRVLSQKIKSGDVRGKDGRLAA